MAGTTGSKALSAQVKPLYPKKKRVPPGGSSRWSSQNKAKKR